MARPTKKEARVSMPLDLRSTELVVGGTPLVVLSYLLPSEGDVDARTTALTNAEREVLTLLLAGRKNAEIASARRTAVRTVSKQIDAIYRKLGVHSRRELTVRLAR